MAQTGTARILQMAFAQDEHAPDDGTVERILDAALELAAASGLRNLTMDDVAARAGVGRMTVYRRFGGRQELVDALAVRECRRCLARISSALDLDAPVADRAAELLVVTLEVIRDHPLLARLARVEPEALLRELTRDGSAIFKLINSFLVGLIARAQSEGELPDGDPALAAELAVRLGATFVLMPHTVLPVDDPQRTRALVSDLVARALAPA